jgi:peptidoglycan/LPS O-acetylase OafA/YrhL
MTKKINFNILESLRGLAALYVCIGHCRAVLWIGGTEYVKQHPSLSAMDYAVLALNMMTRLSSEFVIVFFVLSGFSIAHSLRNSKAPLPFYKRRFIRLYPPYIAALLWGMLIIGIIQLISPHLTDGTYSTATLDRLLYSKQLFTWNYIFKSLIYLPPLDGILGPFWSLTQEVIFYLLAPLLFRNKNSYYFLSALLFSFSVLNSNMHLIGESIITNFFFYNFFFAVGAWAYYNYDRILKKTISLLDAKALWISLALFFLMVGISLKGFSNLNALVAAVMSLILILYFSHNDKKIKWLMQVGVFSYTLYITHYPTIFLYLTLYFLITNANPPYIHNNFVFIPCIFLCLGVAYTHYYFVERKSKQILDKLRRREVERKEEVKPAVTSTITAEKTNW